MPVVLDTNVWISALIQEKGIPRRLVDAAMEGQLTVFSSEEQLRELMGVLESKEFRVSHEVAELFCEQVGKTVSIALPNELTPEVASLISDPGDRAVARLAQQTPALLITGDKRLQELDGRYGLQVKAPAEFARTNLNLPQP